MQKIIGQLKTHEGIAKPASILGAFEGFKGMKTVLETLLARLKKRDKVLILGTPKQIGEQAGGYLKAWQQQRIGKGVICRIIADPDAPSWEDLWWKKSKKEKLTFTKRSKSNSPAYLVITKESVATVYFAANILSFIVTHPSIASRYQEFFQEIWNQFPQS